MSSFWSKWRRSSPLIKIKKMKKYSLKLLFVLLVSFSNIIVFSQSSNYFETAKNIEIFTDLYKELDIFYVDEVNSGELIKTAIDNMLKSLDPYTTYIPESKIEDYKFMTTGEYGGIGAMITKIEDYIYISEPYEGFAAQKAGLMAGDKILEVNGVSSKGKTTQELSEILKGQPNTEVNILIERDTGTHFLVKFNREKVSIKSVPYYGILGDDIGYIKLRSFTRGCGNEVKEALRSLKSQKELNGIILDLRNNGGGLLNESIDIVNLFVPKGETVVVTKGKIKDWEKTYRTKYQPQDTTTPLVILINGQSASASEIVSGAIQDLDRGVVIGKKSFGKGLVQQTRKLSYNAQLKVTVAKYYIPSGRCIQSLDYSSKNIDGSGDKIPDSLTSIFYTKNGREVKDGGGINPDIIIEDSIPSDILISLVRNRLIFDYATQYRLKHLNISDPENYILTDDDYYDFQDFLLGKEYNYITGVEKSIEELEKTAKEEKYHSLISDQLDVMLNKIRDEKKHDITHNKDEIKHVLSSEIISRYYYQKGRIIEELKYDDNINTSIEVFENLDYYNLILSEK